MSRFHIYRYAIQLWNSQRRGNNRKKSPRKENLFIFVDTLLGLKPAYSAVAFAARRCWAYWPNVRCVSFCCIFFTARASSVCKMELWLSERIPWKHNPDLFVARQHFPSRMQARVFSELLFGIYIDSSATCDVLDFIRLWWRHNARRGQQWNLD